MKKCETPTVFRIFWLSRRVSADAFFVFPLIRTTQKAHPQRVRFLRANPVPFRFF